MRDQRSLTRQHCLRFDLLCWKSNGGDFKVYQTLNCLEADSCLDCWLQFWPMNLTQRLKRKTNGCHRTCALFCVCVCRSKFTEVNSVICMHCEFFLMYINNSFTVQFHSIHQHEALVLIYLILWPKWQHGKIIMKMAAPVFCIVFKNITNERSLPDLSELCICVTSGL